VDFRRLLTRTQEKAGGIWSNVLGSFAQAKSDERPILCLNHDNELVQRLASVGDADAVPHAVELLYVHALLLGHQPLRAPEQQLLPKAILAFLELGLPQRPRGLLQ
jgi:molecular chaperone HtpG